MANKFQVGLSVMLFLIFSKCLVAQALELPEPPFLLVLGIAQDGGVPQAGTKTHPGWDNVSFKQHVVCLAIVDPADSTRWLFEATPDFPEQLHLLDKAAPVKNKPGLDGIFITHAHIGHYTGLMFLGHEALGAIRTPVYAMPKMSHFLKTNGPWHQLVKYENIVLRSLHEGVTVKLNKRLAVTPLLVPHRQEYSEVVGFRIAGPRKSVLFIPDIDSWKEWDEAGMHIEDVLTTVDVAYIDATFYGNGEIPGRDMSGFPHPFITHSMARFKPLSVEERAKIRFIHFNHTNPALWPESEARKTIERNGFNLAEELEKVVL